ncbi:RHS repeat domain-containing protein [Pseudomonas luteola]|uniref:RHS domain-containing protein n=1 Tax=Pseudomonas luteola TaxID=47886 RepID=A0ABS0MNY2_PSELU|nr:RHS repeat-associated core domain-containing protein [Pseudomonas luteola]MBH3438421.1 RHS domain-containing protein [Pseudomonas luteola]
MRIQGSLTSRFGYDSFGRKRWQAAIELPHEQLSQLNAQKNSLLGHPEHPATLIHRRYEYSKAGELLRQIDKHRGATDYKYDAIGQLRSREPHHPQLGNEDFGYDPAGNLSASQALSPDNRLKAWKDLRLTYDAWGNVSERHSSNGYQRFTYDCENRLVKAETYRGHDSLSQASYEYDCLGRRIAKHVLTEDKTETTRFLWQGLRMLQEQKADLYSLYIYEAGSYAPLARVDTDPSQPDQKPKRYYFHTDQIGTPLEVTDDTGGMVWHAYYNTWGALEALVPREFEQNLQFQGQYYDAETGLHYNTFRYYDPVVGRFTTQDPIGLLRGKSLYQYGINPILWSDPWGWSGKPANSPSLEKWIEKKGGNCTYRNRNKNLGV